MIPSPICLLCNQKTIGTYVHMVYECTAVRTFWKQVIDIVSEIIGVHIPCLPNIVLLNDDSSLDLQNHQKRVLFAGLTAAKKIIVIRWKPPHTLFIKQWISSFHDLLISELSIASANKAKGETLEAIKRAADLVISFM